MINGEASPCGFCYTHSLHERFAIVDTVRRNACFSCAEIDYGDDEALPLKTRSGEKV